MRNKFVILAVVIILIVGVSGMYWYLQMSLQRNVDTITATTTKTQIASSSAPIPVQPTSTTTTDDHPGMKLYRNDQWGFEFWYPDGWEWQANVFGSPNSKFNLTVMTINGKNTDQSMVINIVVPEFAARAVTSDHPYDPMPVHLNVDGADSVEYHFSQGEYPETIIDVPFKSYHILIGANSAEDAKLATVISDFKFVSTK